MRKYVTGFIAVMAAVIAALPMQSLAAGADGTGKAAEKDKVILEESGKDQGTVEVKLSMPHSNGEGLNAIRMSFRIETNEANPDVTFTFGENETAPEYIHESYYHPTKGKNEGTLNIYAASAKELFKLGDKDADTNWKIGEISVKMKNGPGITARVRMVPGSLEIVYGDRAKAIGSNTMSVSYPNGGSSVTVKNGNGGTGKLPDEEAEKSALKEALDKWNKIKEAGDAEEKYTHESYAALKDAAEKAQKVCEDKKASQEEVFKAQEALQAALKGLELSDGSQPGQSVRDELKNVLEVWEAKYKENEAKYDSDLYGALRKAVEEAQKVMENPEATSDDDIKAAIKAVKDAMNRLGGGPRDYRAELEALLSEVKGYKESNYTAESYQKLKEAIEKAEKILAKSDASGGELEKALQDLQNAQGDLVAKDSSGAAVVSDKKKEKSAQTGDTQMIFAYAAAALLAAGVGAAAYRRRRR